eukprot:8726076-Lingulodinium_polyedra.AAC.1
MAWSQICHATQIDLPPLPSYLSAVEDLLQRCRRVAGLLEPWAVERTAAWPLWIERAARQEGAFATSALEEDVGVEGV